MNRYRLACLSVLFLLLTALPVAAQQAIIERQLLERSFEQERLDLARQQATNPRPSTPGEARAQQRLDQSQRLQQQLLQEHQRREALTFEQRTRDLPEAQQRQQWQIEQQLLQRERDQQLQSFSQERPG